MSRRACHECGRYVAVRFVPEHEDCGACGRSRLHGYCGTCYVKQFPVREWAPDMPPDALVWPGTLLRGLAVAVAIFAIALPVWVTRTPERVWPQIQSLLGEPERAVPVLRGVFPARDRPVCEFSLDDPAATVDTSAIATPTSRSSR